jgi:hypothetical protein
MVTAMARIKVSPCGLADQGFSGRPLDGRLRRPVDAVHHATGGSCGAA